jgi:hypothetical protein
MLAAPISLIKPGFSSRLEKSGLLAAQQGMSNTFPGD